MEQLNQQFDQKTCSSIKPVAIQCVKQFFYEFFHPIKVNFDFLELNTFIDLLCMEKGVKIDKKLIKIDKN